MEFAGEEDDILELAIKHRDKLSTILDVSAEESSESELAAMVSFAIAFPGGFMALVDTYDVKRYFRYVAVYYLCNTSCLQQIYASVHCAHVEAANVKFIFVSMCVCSVFIIGLHSH